jgi:superfamily II DNA/RNA helicase
VATDVVARGIHVDDVPCVVHFDPPGDAESYVHRSGRTGRAGSSGTVVSLVPDEQQGEVRALQRDLGFPAKFTVPFEAAEMSSRRSMPAAKPKSTPEPKSTTPQAKSTPEPKSTTPQAKSTPQARSRDERPERASNSARAARHKRNGSQLTGTVKFFDTQRGYGFLAAPDGSDVFVHHTKLLGSAARRPHLRKGQQVVFELGAGRRGQEAHNVKVASAVAS